MDKSNHDNKGGRPQPKSRWLKLSETKCCRFRWDFGNSGADNVGRTVSRWKYGISHKFGIICGVKFVRLSGREVTSTSLANVRQRSQQGSPEFRAKVWLQSCWRFLCSTVGCTCCKIFEDIWSRVSFKVPCKTHFDTNLKFAAVGLYGCSWRPIY